MNLLDTLKDALSFAESICGFRCNAEYNPCEAQELANNLKDALAELEKAEPVAWIRPSDAEAEEAETLRPLVLKFAGAVNLDEDWCKDNEPTINILRACLHKYMDAMALIRQGVRAVEK